MTGFAIKEGKPQISWTAVKRSQSKAVENLMCLIKSLHAASYFWPFTQWKLFWFLQQHSEAGTIIFTVYKYKTDMPKWQ